MGSQKLLQILKCILNEQPLSDCSIAPEDWQHLIWLAKRHNIMGMLGCTLPLLSEQQMPPQKERDSLRRQAMAMAMVNSNQIHELGRIQDAFEQQGIWNMPLKGCTTRQLYPLPDMRTMNDLDILCKPSQQRQIRKIMSQLGYADFQEGRKHDVYSKKPYIRIEMHREMVPARSPFSKYYRDIWNRCMPMSGCRYNCQLSATDAFVYNLVHLAEHLEEGGVGIRFITDVYAFDNSPTVDREQLHSTLESLGLWQLYCNVSALAQQWFSLNPPTLEQSQAQLIERFGHFVLAGGLFGSAETGSALAVQKEGRVRYFLKACFPGYREMCSMYSWLEKWPFLLPWSWFLRGVRSLLYRRKSIKKQFHVSATGDVQKGNEIRQLYHDIGYDR